VRYQRCKYFDEGYCYNMGLRNGLNTLGCVGYDRCESYKTEQKLPNSGRIDQISQNGNDGSHYLVEKVAKVLADDPQDWELYVHTAIQLIGMIKDE